MDERLDVEMFFPQGGLHLRHARFCFRVSYYKDKRGALCQLRSFVPVKLLGD